MSRYIDADKLIESLELSIKSWSCDRNSNAPTIVRTYQDVVYRVEQYITADVQEVRHGKWVRKEPEGAIFADYECSVCSSYPTGSIRSHYCPNCGARMDGKEEQK